jgi:glucokinase
MIYGGARGMRDFIELTLGTGLGAGVVANGEMIYGYGGTAGELGHIIVEKNGRQCGCGRRGCLETYVSATGLVRTMNELFATEMIDSKLRNLPKTELTSEAIANAATAGDELALKAFDITARYLGEAIANQVAFTFPEAIFLFGGLAKSGELLFKPTKHYMEEALLRNYKGQVKLLPSGIDGANAAILGASALVWQELKNQEQQ